MFEYVFCLIFVKCFMDSLVRFELREMVYLREETRNRNLLMPEFDRPEMMILRG